MKTFRMFLFLIAVAGSIIPSAGAFAQDTVDVTFRYRPPTTQSAVSLVGEFNSWNTSSSPMTAVGGNTFTRTMRLISTGAAYTPGAYEYKFWYTGVSNWPNDPLNPRIDVSRNSNSILYVKNPTIYQLATDQQIAANSLTALVRTKTPVISAYLFPKLNSLLDTSALTIRIDNTTYTSVGRFYDPVTKLFQFVAPTPLLNGAHKAVIAVGAVADSVTFTVQAGFVQIVTRGGFTTRNPYRAIIGYIEDTKITAVKLVRNSTDTTIGTVAAGSFTIVDTLAEGANTFRAVTTDSLGAVQTSDPVTITYFVNHAPSASARALFASASDVTLSASASTDPDAQTLSFEWQDDPRTPLGLSGKTANVVTVTKPSQPGEYYFTLIAGDPDGNVDTTTAYFVIDEAGGLVTPTIASNPRWVKEARVYFLFPKAASSAGTLNAAALRLPNIKALGFNVVWLMPIMKNAYPIDNGIGPGYNITDFTNVAPEYGTNQDFKNFMTQAHALGLKVILDITPNHTSRSHPWSVDAHTFKQASPYWNWYQHTTDGTNTNGLGWGTDADGFVYYGGFGDQLLNINWADVDLRNEMINVFKYWVQQYGVDGFRFDVYWGPHRRYGEAAMGKPVRDALKKIRPDIFLLAEDDGTGSGTETIYADYSSSGINGGVDAAYDFKLYFNQIRNFQFSSVAIDNLHNEINNGGYFPGPNSLYMRFMESQDEDRIFYLDPNASSYYDVNAATAYQKTMPMASVIFTVPGFPMLWNGQEVGYGYGISGSKIARSRSVINWSAGGKALLEPHYQKMAHIRGQFPAFTTQQFIRLTATNSLVYAFARPKSGANGIVAVNFSNATVNTTMILTSSALTGVVDNTPYVLSDIYADSSRTIQFSSGSVSVPITLAPYGTSVMILADSAKKLVLPPSTGVEEEGTKNSLPTRTALAQNFPNPFNPETSIRYQLSHPGSVDLRVFDVLGREVAILVNQQQSPGQYSVLFNASSLPSGVYIYRLTTGEYAESRKMVLAK